MQKEERQRKIEWFRESQWQLYVQKLYESKGRRSEKFMKQFETPYIRALRDGGVDWCDTFMDSYQETDWFTRPSMHPGPWIVARK